MDTTEKRELFTIPNFAHLGTAKQMYLDKNKFLDVEILQTGCFELELTRFVTSYLDKAKKCIDVGANIGYYSMIFCELAQHVLIFEPLDDFLTVLQQNLQCNGYTNYTICPYGLSDKNDSLPLYKGECSGTLHWAIQDAPAKTEVIELRPLDEVLDEEPYDLLKIDVDGHDFKVIQGAQNYIERHKPLVIFEIAMLNHALVNTDLREVFHFFDSRGYHIFREDDLSSPCHPLDIFLQKADVTDRSWNFIAQKGRWCCQPQDC